MTLPKNITIRTVRTGDVEKFDQIGFNGLLEFCSTPELKASTALYHERHQKRLFNQLGRMIESNFSQFNERAWVAVRRFRTKSYKPGEWCEEIVGTIMVKPRPRKKKSCKKGAQLDSVSVVPKWRGKGIAQELMRTAEEHCAQCGIGSLHLTTQDNLTRAIAFYEKLGYVKGKEKKWESYTLIPYSKSLSEVKKSLQLRKCKKRKKSTTKTGQVVTKKSR